ncbi:phytanoyl-CoA dioxygenase family protein [Pseudoalteromonas peptidolytica]|uniref:Phytanoyl-CoA dioxygenase n=1 Tax=Pseudoalteromonas peptidolytica F12-50-A1 TaxID=1315280 RepID=A0A8I0T4X8_9GAMM|nr:phytanoyl-CoA dioxygenase family protein [Pseudoalteromonas peptidolytica]MBE0346668.1 hypothetical protein [Pseudoalteromonas peptidolytica F12-50-A1]GEK09619.1 hypothetical protein PPE03_18680 [Pseudoalteromonas peptidolytica]
MPDKSIFRIINGIDIYQNKKDVVVVMRESTPNQKLYRLPILDRIWSEANCQVMNKEQRFVPVDFALAKTVFDIIGISQDQAHKLKYQYAHSYTQFVEAIIKLAPQTTEKVELLQHITCGASCPQSYHNKLNTVKQMADVLSADDLACWNTNGYVVVKNAISPSNCQRALSVICDFLEVDINNPDTWYNLDGDKISKTMVHLVQHSALEENRNAVRIHKAFSQLWQTERLQVSADRCGFNPPETVNDVYQGTDLHWDLDFSQPLSFGTQGILYLSDTSQDQGATTVVPGFHHRLANWLDDMPFDPNQPRPDYFHQQGSQAIAANAGDLVIWHHFLPHGGSPNKATMPRIVQYINMQPLQTV